MWSAAYIVRDSSTRECSHLRSSSSRFNIEIYKITPNLYYIFPLIYIQQDQPRGLVVGVSHY
jgi:hypothetical protein